MHHLYRSAPYVCEEIQRRSTGIWVRGFQIYPKVFPEHADSPATDGRAAESGARLADAIEQMDRTIEPPTQRSR
ncbi:MAG: hypothetical protein R2742_05835 [Micropruina glycogenica]